MPSDQLRSALHALAMNFTDSVLAAIRAGSIEDLLGQPGGAPKRRGGGGGGQPDPLGVGRGSGRLPRRSAVHLAQNLSKGVALGKTSKTGCRAEEIRKPLQLDVREMPRVLREGVKTKKLKATGQKRATTYTAR